MNLELVREDDSASNIITLAYGMEQNLGWFYRALIAKTQDQELIFLLGKLAAVEDKHRHYLFQLFSALEPSSSNLESFEAEATTKLMEGGFERDSFMSQNERFLSSVQDMLDLSMMLETQALDLYLRFAGKTVNQETKKAIYRIADEEKAHLALLGELRDKKTL